MILRCDSFSSQKYKGFTASSTNVLRITQRTVRTTSSTSPSSLQLGTNSNEIIPLKRGTTVALITPMDTNGNVNMNDLKKLLQYHITSGTDNLCILGTTGEASVLSETEKMAILKVVVEEVKGIMPIMVGTGSIDPKKVKDDTIKAADLGCDAALIVTPYYVKPPQRGLIHHYTSIADISNGLPVVMYNVPGRTGVNLQDDTIALLSQHSNIIGIKDATGNLDRLQNLKSLLLKQQNIASKDNFLLYSGDDGTTIDYILNGGDGCISVTCNIAAKQMYDAVHSALNGDKQNAIQYNIPLDILHTQLFIESNPIPCKYAAKQLQLITSDYARPPLDYIDPIYQSIINDALQQSGLLITN